jgi:hypothetical protein
MLGRSPRLSHNLMRWLIIALMVLNGIQLVLLQGAINSSALGQVDTTWMYTAVSAGICLVAGGLIAFAFARSRSAGGEETRQ